MGVVWLLHVVWANVKHMEFSVKILAFIYAYLILTIHVFLWVLMCGNPPTLVLKVFVITNPDYCFLCPSDAPGAPSAPVVTDVFSDSCALTWSPPDFDGGAPITGYYVERSSGRTGRWIRITRDAITEKCCHRVTELIQDNEYQFRVIAMNKVGLGPAGPASEPVIAKDPWGKSFVVS